MKTKNTCKKEVFEKPQLEIVKTTVSKEFANEIRVEAYKNKLSVSKFLSKALVAYMVKF